ncbi:MAG: hypothetical protein OXE78_07350 [Gammaproteobacteria bacterium]|nr:hypothetical protein [Gammaproteobacteria bacterium]
MTTATEGDQQIVIPSGETAIAYAVPTVDDRVDEPNGLVTLTLRDSAAYGNGELASVTVAIVDDDMAGVTVNESDGSTVVSESGGVDTHTLVLDSEPLANVVIAVASTDSTATTVEPASLTFTPENWSTKQAVTVTGVGDDIHQSSGRMATITHTAVSADPAYDGIEINDVEITIADDDMLPLVSFGASAYEVEEGDNALAITLNTSRPSLHDTTVAITCANGSATGGVDYAACPESATITGGELSAMFTIAIYDDRIAEGDENFTVAINAEMLTLHITGEDPASTTVVIRDNDTIGVIVNESDGGTVVSENGGTDTYTLVLDSEPLSEVAIAVTSDNPATAAIEPVSLSFMPENWDVPQTVTVTGVDDNLDNDGDARIALIGHTVTSTDPAYNGITVSDVAIMVSDDDEAVSAETLDAAVGGLARFGRAVGEQAVDAVRWRLTERRPAGSETEVGGVPLRSFLPGTSIPGFSDAEQDQLDSGSGGQVLGNSTGFGAAAWLPGIHDQVGSMSAADNLPAGTGTGRASGLDNARSFLGRLALAGFESVRKTESGATQGFWGRASHSGFRGDKEGLSLDGDATTAGIGTDWSRNDWLIGLMVTRSLGETDFGGTAAGGLETDLTAIVPYGGWKVSDSLRAWGAVGTGLGTAMLLTGEGRALETDTDWQLAAGGAEGTLAGADWLPGARLSWNADGLYTRAGAESFKSIGVGGQQLASELGGTTMRLRFGFEGAWEWHPAPNQALRPRVELGLRRDSGDAETGFGLDFGGSLDWTDTGSGLTVGLSGRMLALHGEDEFENWGVSASLEYDPRPETEQGFALALLRGLGGLAPGRAQALFGVGGFPGLTAPVVPADAGDWRIEASYGLAAGRRGLSGSFYGQVEGTVRAEALRLGYRIAPEAAAKLNLNIDLWVSPSLREATPGPTAGFTLQWVW